MLLHSIIKKLFITIPILIFVGCGPNNVVESPYGFKAQDGYPPWNGEQLCQNSGWIIASTNKIIPIIQEEASKLGIVLPEMEDWFLCQIEYPEMCFNGNYYLGPCYQGKCARRRGCVARESTWVSRLWPPICTKEWPVENNCVFIGASGSGLLLDLAHELIETYAFRCLANAHTGVWQELNKVVTMRLKTSKAK